MDGNVCAAFRRGGLHFSRGTSLSVFARIGARAGLPTRVSVDTITNSRCRFLYVGGKNNSTGGTTLCRRAGSLLRPRGLATFLVRGVGSLNATTYPPCRVTFIIKKLSTSRALGITGLTSAGCCSGLPADKGRRKRTFHSVRLRGILLRTDRRFNVNTRFKNGCFTRSVHIVHLPHRNNSYPVTVTLSYSTSHGVGTGVGGRNV